MSDVLCLPELVVGAIILGLAFTVMRHDRTIFWEMSVVALSSSANAALQTGVLDIHLFRASPHIDKLTTYFVVLGALKLFIVFVYYVALLLLCITVVRRVRAQWQKKA